MATNESLTIEDGYRAMFAFLESHYERTKSDDLAVLLGGMSLMRDGSPADPAMWADWVSAVSNVCAKTDDPTQRLMTGP